MTITKTNYATHPGEHLKEEIEARGWSQRDVAFILGCPEQAINTIISGKRGISPDMAKALGTAFDVPPEFFANLQKGYDLSRAHEPSPEVGLRAKMQNNYPVREMIKRGWIEDADAKMLEMQLVHFFGVSNSNDVPYLEHAAKKSSYEKKGVLPVQLAWLFRVKQIAKSISVQKYSEQALIESVGKLKALRIAPEEARHAPRILAECGVRLVIVEALPKGNIDGVCFWLDKQSPVIGLTSRFDRIDNFWFVLRHEIEHVLNKDGQGSEIIDVDTGKKSASSSGSTEQEEKQANAAAADFCAPTEKIESFMKRKHPFYYEKDVLAFASLHGLHPGLVVGQMQYRLDRHDYLRKHLVKIRQFVLPGAIVDGWGQSSTVTFNAGVL